MSYSNIMGDRSVTVYYMHYHVVWQANITLGVVAVCYDAETADIALRVARELFPNDHISIEHHESDYVDNGSLEFIVSRYDDKYRLGEWTATRCRKIADAVYRHVRETSPTLACSISRGSDVLVRFSERMGERRAPILGS